jgi:hypothetical protein
MVHDPLSLAMLSQAKPTSKENISLWQKITLECADEKSYNYLHYDLHS